MSIGESSQWAAYAILDAAIYVWSTGLVLTIGLVLLRMFTRYRPSWWWIAVTTVVTAVFFAMERGLLEVLDDTPPVPFG